jgi:hypothetical protein
VRSSPSLQPDRSWKKSIIENGNSKLETNSRFYHSYSATDEAYPVHILAPIQAARTIHSWDSGAVEYSNCQFQHRLSLLRLGLEIGNDSKEKQGLLRWARQRRLLLTEVAVTTVKAVRAELEEFA